MKVAVIGSRSITDVSLEQYLPPETTEIITGGAAGVDALAMAYAQEHGLPLTVLRPDYRRYRRGTPLRRNREIVAQCDYLLALWDGRSRGTRFTINCWRASGKPGRVVTGE